MKTNQAPKTQPGTNLTLNTDAIGPDGAFDPRYTCDVDNSSPELRWENPPTETSSFALLAEDPDAPNGIFTHWIVYNIPAHVHHLPAGIPPQDSLPNGIRQGLNSYGKLGYAGPCPPYGDRPHRYVFNIYALSKYKPIVTRLNRDEFLQMIHPHILAQGQIIGRYQRSVQKAG